MDKRPMRILLVDDEKRNFVFTREQLLDVPGQEIGSCLCPWLAVQFFDECLLLFLLRTSSAGYPNHTFQLIFFAKLSSNFVLQNGFGFKRRAVGHPPVCVPDKMNRQAAAV